MNDSIERFDKIYEETKERVNNEIRNVKKNQSDLKAELADLIDTQKYLHLIEDENRRIKKEKESGKFDVSLEDKIYANVQPEIIVNEEYFRAQGMNPDGTPLEVGIERETMNGMLDEDAASNLSDDLDKEYFGWKEAEDMNSSSEKHSKKKGGFGSFFGKK